MAAKPGWICSACSNGSASSLRSIRCVRALSRYAFARPVEQQIIDRRVGFDHDNYRSYCQRMLAYYKCTCLLSLWLPHIPTYTRRNGARFLPQVYQKDTSVCPNNLISISVTISMSATWFISAFDCRRIGLSASWFFRQVVHKQTPVISETWRLTIDALNCPHRQLNCYPVPPPSSSAHSALHPHAS